MNTADDTAEDTITLSIVRAVLVAIVLVWTVTATACLIDTQMYLSAGFCNVGAPGSGASHWVKCSSLPERPE